MFARRRLEGEIFLLSTRIGQKLRYVAIIGFPLAFGSAILMTIGVTPKLVLPGILALHLIASFLFLRTRMSAVRAEERAPLAITWNPAVVGAGEYATLVQGYLNLLGGSQGSRLKKSRMGVHRLSTAATWLAQELAVTDQYVWGVRRIPSYWSYLAYILRNLFRLIVEMLYDILFSVTSASRDAHYFMAFKRIRSAHRAFDHLNLPGEFHLKEVTDREEVEKRKEALQRTLALFKEKGISARIVNDASGRVVIVVGIAPESVDSVIRNMLPGKQDEGDVTTRQDSL